MKIPEGRLTREFVDTIKRFTDGNVGKSNIVSALAQIPTERLTPEFESAVNIFDRGISSYQDRRKAKIIEELAKLTSERITPEFVGAVSRISNGLLHNTRGDGYESSIIRLSHNVSDDSFQHVAAYFTESRMQAIRHFLSESLICSLFARLTRLNTSNERIAEIDRTVALYRHQGPAAQPQNYQAVVGGVDIHRYAQAKVFSNATGSKHTTLKNAVVNKLERALNGQQLVSYQSALSATKKEIERAYNQKISAIDGDLAADIIQKSAAKELALRDKNWQHEAIGAGGDDAKAQKAFSLVYTLLSSEPEKLKLWMSTYLEESLNARGNDTRSCVMGMRERVTTSLRSVISQIPDKTGVYKELHGLFSQVEGTVLANKFLQMINLADPNNHTGIATVLGQAGITRESTADAAAEAYGGYVRNSLATYGLIDKDIESYVEAAIDQMEEMFDMEVKILLPSDASSSSKAASSMPSDSSYLSSESIAMDMDIAESSGQTRKRQRSEEETELDATQHAVRERPSASSALLTQEELREKRLKVMDPNH
ncbi:MAG: hypothetical protein NWQ29_03600 [Alphaproteobacteria bacterium]|nr:hypothetical protein [Alphaproteobacteria bacterium]